MESCLRYDLALTEVGGLRKDIRIGDLAGVVGWKFRRGSGASATCFNGDVLYLPPCLAA